MALDRQTVERNTAAHIQQVRRTRPVTEAEKRSIRVLHETAAIKAERRANHERR